MQQEWTPEIQIDEGFASLLIGEQFPALAGASISEIGRGWDNAAFLVDGRYIFRFPHRAIAAPLIDIEMSVLPLLADRMATLIPLPAYAGERSARYPWRFYGYERIPGKTACAAELSGPNRIALAVPLGKSLRQLHAMDAGAARSAGLPADGWGRFNHSARMAKVQPRLHELQSAGLLPQAADFLEEMARINPRVDEGARTIVHGDLYARHVMIAQGALSGIIDWGDAHFGNPAVDLAAAYLLLPPIAHDEFRSAYGAIDARTWELAKYRALDSAAMQMYFAYHSNDKDLLQAADLAFGYLRKAQA